MCGHGRHHGGHGCGCGQHEHEGDCECEESRHEHAGQSGFRRRFESKAELVERLEQYLKSLQAEAQAVEERLTELRGGA